MKLLWRSDNRRHSFCYESDRGRIQLCFRNCAFSLYDKNTVQPQQAKRKPLTIGTALNYYTPFHIETIGRLSINGHDYVMPYSSPWTRQACSAFGTDKKRKTLFRANVHHDVERKRRSSMASVRCTACNNLTYTVSDITLTYSTHTFLRATLSIRECAANGRSCCATHASITPTPIFRHEPR